MSLKLPKNHLYYYNQTIEKSKKYIKLGYWSDIDISTLELWLKNFNTEEEKYFSALILDKIIYRNDMTIKSMFSKIFHINLPNILEDKNIYIYDYNLEDWEKLLRNPNNKSILPFRFTTITSEKELGDSGADYMRRLRRYYLVNKELIIRVDAQKDENVNTLIVIDDLIGSGEQTKTFIEENLKSINEYKYVIFMPLMAHINGINNVNEKKRKLEYSEQLHEDIIYIKPVEIIYEDSSFFNEKNLALLIDGQNTLQELKFFYDSFIQNKLDTKEIYGHGELSLLLMFSSGVPDNTLPLIHESSEYNNWNALYEKF